jgi:anti-anti-sigma factor
MLEVRDNVPGVLQVVGSVDLGTVSELREKLLAAVERAVADAVPMLSVDLSGADLIDAAGLGVLLGAHRRARRGGTRLRLVHLSPQLQHLLLVSRLYRVLDIDNRDTALPGAPADGVPEQRAEASEGRPLTSP